MPETHRLRDSDAQMQQDAGERENHVGARARIRCERDRQRGGLPLAVANSACRVLSIFGRIMVGGELHNKGEHKSNGQ